MDVNTSLIQIILGTAVQSIGTIFSTVAVVLALSYVFKIATGMESEETQFEPMTEPAPEISDDSHDEKISDDSSEETSND